MPLVKLPVWKIDEARALVRDLNVAVRAFDFHVALGGGVINNGESLKDLDLYVLPYYHKDCNFDFGALDRVLTAMFGPSDDMCPPSVSEAADRCYRAARVYHNKGKRIDLFIVEPR